MPGEAKELIYFPYLRELSRVSNVSGRAALTGIAASGPAPASSSRARKQR